MRLVEAAYKALGITQYRYRLSLGDKADKEKYVDNDAMWELGERMLREAMDALGLPYVEAKGEAAFYGPKLDIQLADVMGHEETYSTFSWISTCRASSTCTTWAPTARNIAR
jgi:threonyl-tRNA synthetase